VSVAQGIRAEPVVFSAASRERARDGQLSFLDLRPGMWWTLREALDPQQGEGIALPPDKRLAAQLAAPDGEHDDLPVEAFDFEGSIAEIRARASRH
jgi:hypothetical protein